MPSVTKGILTNGLGGDASSTIIGKFTLGLASITVEILPPEPAPSYGGPGVIIPRRKYQTVRITVRFNNRTWKKVYKISILRTRIIITITKVINTISTNITLVVSKMKKLLNNFRIKRK